MPAYLPILMLAGALLLFYVSVRDVERAFGPAGHLLPLLGVVVWAAASGHPDVALGASLSGAVAAMGLAGGLTLMQRPTLESPPLAVAAGSVAAVTPATYTTWALLVPSALAIFMVGMSGLVSWVAMGALAVLSAAILPAVLSPRLRGTRAEKEGVVIALSIPVAALAGWAAVQGVGMLADGPRHPPAALLAATVLGPASVLPLLSYSTTRARDGDGFAAMGSCVSFATGAALLLPAVAGLAYWIRTRAFAPFPITLWRVECVLLLVLGVLMVPLAARRFTPTRRDGGILLGLYVLYVLVSTVSGLRVG